MIQSKLICFIQNSEFEYLKQIHTKTFTVL